MTSSRCEMILVLMCSGRSSLTHSPQVWCVAKQVTCIAQASMRNRSQGKIRRRILREPRRGAVNPTCTVLLSASAALLTSLPSAAHHSVAVNFERGEPIEIRGTVKEAHMRNPHSQYVVAVPEKDGTVTDWLV